VLTSLGKGFTGLAGAGERQNKAGEELADLFAELAGAGEGLAGHFTKLAEAGERLADLFTQLAGTGEELADLFTELARAGERLADLFAQLAGDFAAKKWIPPLSPRGGRGAPGLPTIFAILIPDPH
jgi:ABC-type transporter Mla subunit MlaD